MYVLTVRNVNEALHRGMGLLWQEGTLRRSRYGDVIELDEPLTTRYLFPMERVLFDPIRDANPFFHLMEALWILGGRADVAFLTQFNKRMAEFSDDGETFHAPYGARLRRHFGTTRYVDTGIGESRGWEFRGWEPLDQLDVVIQMLKDDPNNRRIVASIWDPTQDLDATSKDIPCNDTIKFEARRGKLDMVVFCRSNDALWGAYGANAVQFSMIQEYVAAMSGLPMGAYEQISCNFHAYTERADPGQSYTGHTSRIRQREFDLYQAPINAVTSHPLVDDPARWDADNARFLHWVDQHWPSPMAHLPAYANSFFPDVAEQMYLAWRLHKDGRTADAAALLALGGGATMDWRVAGMQWLTRRLT